MKRRRKPLGLLADGCLRRAHVPAFGLKHLRHRPLGRLARAVRGAVLGERRRVRTARIERLHEPQRKRTRGLDLHDSLTRAQKRGHGGARSEQVSVGDALIERDAQIPRHVGRRQGRRGVGDALAPYEHRGRKGCVTRDELVDLGGNLLAAQGAALMDELMQGVLSVVAHWLGPDTAIQMAASYAGTPAGVTDGSAAIAIIGGADGPTAIFVTSRYNAQVLWGLAVKVFSNVLVIVLNYVFSKLIIFKKK